MSEADAMQPWELSRYLRREGWVPNDALSDDDVEVYESAAVRDENGEPVRLFAPRSHDLPDFAVMRDDLVRALAALAGQSPEAVARAIVSAQADVLSARVLVSDGGHRLPVRDMLSALRALFDLFLAAASAEARKPAPYFSSPPKEARRFADALLVPAPRPGSVLLQIESPLDAPVGAGITPAPPATRVPDDELPFARRVVVRIARGLRDAPAQGAGSPEESFARGLNANMCDALASLHDGLRGIPVDFGVRWAPHVAVPDDVERLPPIRFDARRFEVVREIGAALRQPAGPRHRALVGHVVELRARRLALPMAGEQVVLLAAEIDGKSQLVRLSLEEPDYQIACMAHLERRPVRVAGVLERIRRTWQITRYDAFEMEGGAPVDRASRT